MTSIRFVGDLPLWLGLLLAVVASALSWRYYRREQHDLSPRLRWLLPLLRSFAFFLAVLALAGPVLHHRTIIGELGRVRIDLKRSVPAISALTKAIRLDKRSAEWHRLHPCPFQVVAWILEIIIERLSRSRY